MISEAQLKNRIHKDSIGRKDQILLALAMNDPRPVTVAEIRSVLVDVGVTSARRWNLASVLATLAPLAIRSGGGWELTEDGRNSVRLLMGEARRLITHPLRDNLESLPSEDLRAFVTEAIGCIEVGHYRAAVVLSWCGAIGVLYEHVLSLHLRPFNDEAQRRDAKWKRAKTLDDLSRMKEHEFLQVLESISVIGKSVKGELEGCLRLRNGCGHPNSLRVAEHRVASHVETLVQNVFAKFLAPAA